MGGAGKSAVPAARDNKTWGDWRETLRRMPRHQRPEGLLSDTRVAASLVDLCGTDVLDRLPLPLGVLRPRLHRSLRRLARVAGHAGEQPVFSPGAF